MEQNITEFIEKISPWGVAALALIVIAKPLMPLLVEWVRSNKLGSTLTKQHEQKLTQVNDSVQLLGSNHLHEVKDLLREIVEEQSRMQSSIDRAVDNTNRNFTDLKESLSYLKAKINGKY